MTTPIAQNLAEHAAREKVPAPEQRNAPETSQHTAGVKHEPIAEDLVAPISKQPQGIDPNDPPGAFAKSMAHWVHAHPQAHKHGVGNLVYQYVRSLAASVPYGVSMATVLGGLVGLERLGGHMAEKEGASAITKGIGRNLKGFATFGPARWSLLIGASFTLYRGTSKLGKWLTEYVFNPKDTEERTAQKIHDLPEEMGRKVKEIGPAEASSTPVSAIVLGFIVSAFNKPAGIAGTAYDWTRDNLKSAKGIMGKSAALGRVLTPRTKFVQHAIINTFGYSLFFELGDRLFKDTQIRRGVWPGEHNSIKALKAAPDEYAQGVRANDAGNAPKYEDSAAEAKPEKEHYRFFTSEPGVGRFLFRRVLPTAVGITAYTGAKMRWGAMLGNEFGLNAIKPGESIIRKIPKLAFTEGLATSLFFLIPIVAEPWEKAYDKFWAKKEKLAQLKDHMREQPEAYAQAATPDQVKNYEALLTKVNAKEAANQSVFAQRA